MCKGCGCDIHHHHHDHDHDHHHGHHHDHDHHHQHDHGHKHEGRGPLGAVHEDGIDSARSIAIEENILSENDRFAAQNRKAFAQHKALALNLVSSPGSGKTTLLAETLSSKQLKAAVIEGDLQTDLDAARLRSSGVPIALINTGQGCHLDAHMVGHAMEELPLGTGALDGGVVFIENVGNLVCPAAYDLGEAAKVVLLSVTEGEDKPLKYPDMFVASDLMIVTKIDLLPHLRFDVEACIANARKINPKIEVIRLSSTTGEGMQDWFQWIESKKAG